MEALRAANRGMARAVCQGAKTAKRYAALGAGMEVDAQGYGREPTAMVRGVLSCLFVCLFLTQIHSIPYTHSPNLTLTQIHHNHHPPNFTPPFHFHHPFHSISTPYPSFHYSFTSLIYYTHTSLPSRFNHLRSSTLPFLLFRPIPKPRFPQNHLICFSTLCTLLHFLNNLSSIHTFPTITHNTSFHLTPQQPSHQRYLHMPPRSTSHRSQTCSPSPSHPL